MILALASVAHAAWVLEADTDRRLGRAVRAVRRHADGPPEILDLFTVCVDVSEPGDRLTRRVTRILGHAPEERLDCDVAHYPLGRGWVGVFVEPPATVLDAVLQDVGLPYIDVRREADPSAAVRLCFARAALAEPMALADQLRAEGLTVRSVYEIGACERP